MRVAVNSRAAELLGIRCKELLARSAWHDVPLALPPLDALRALLHALSASGGANTVTRYFRVLVNGGQSAALVCSSSVKILDTCGRVQTVHLHPFSPA